MKTLFLVALLFAFSSGAQLPCGQTVESACEIGDKTVFEWDAMTTNTVGERVLIKRYILGLFSGDEGLFFATTTNTFASLGDSVSMLMRGAVYDVKVRAETETLISPWSDVLYSFRPKGFLGKPNRPRPKQ